MYICICYRSDARASVLHQPKFGFGESGPKTYQICIGHKHFGTLFGPRRPRAIIS